MARLIRIRYPGRCAACGAALAAGTTAWWEAAARVLRCESCGDASAGDAPAAVGMSPPAGGEAGGSAQARSERLRDRREDRIRSRHPRLGGLILALSDEPQSTRAWAQGAEGERQVGARLDSIPGAVVLHDRRIPGSRANIDHLAVATSGVWVVDAKHYRGRVEHRDVGGWFRTNERLFVGARNCMNLVRAMAAQVEAVRAALGEPNSSVPIRAALCFTGAEWGLFSRPFDIDGVAVMWPKALAGAISRAGPLKPEQIPILADTLAVRLKPAA